MKFDPPLIRGTLIRRYKRFLADVVLEDGREVTAHCPNTGSMKSCGQPGDPVLLSFSPSPKRKLAWTWEMTEGPRGLIGIHTGRTNALVGEALREQRIPELAGYETIRSEVAYGKGSRADFLLTGPGQAPCWIEVKNVTLFENDQLCFPDAVTSRGLKHLQELTEQVELKNRAVLFFLVNRPEGTRVRPARHIDPAWSQALEKATLAGVELLAYRTINSVTESVVTSRIPADST